jgi:hypothetical protein
MTKAVEDIQVQHSHNAAGIMNSYLDAIDAIRAEREPTQGELAAYLDAAEQISNEDLAHAVFVAAQR